MTKNDIGYRGPIPARSRNDALLLLESQRADLFTTTATLIADQNSSYLSSFQDHAICLRRIVQPLKVHSKYRSVNGFGNNLKNPFWGAVYTPLGRFGPKSYDDGVFSIRKSVTGSDLPTPRKIVRNVLLKADKAVPAIENTPNNLLLELFVFVARDFAAHAPAEVVDSQENIRCCASGNKNVLSPELSHSACLPIPISDDDPFYKGEKVKCLNGVRSQMASSPASLEYGEILNTATSFLDLSMIYGIDELSLRAVRTFSKGKFNMGSRNIFPVDSRGKFLDKTEILLVTITFATWSMIFARNHNHLAELLTVVNPQWNDETLFQEARRVNIAIFQNLFQELVEKVFKRKVSYDEPYDETLNPSAKVEFLTAGFRLFHSYAQSDMLLIDENGTLSSMTVNDVLGRYDILEKHFEDLLRGALAQPVNTAQYTEEV